MISKNGLQAVFLFIIIAFGMSCTPKANLTHSPAMPVPGKTNSVIQAQNQFAFKIFKLVLQSDPTQTNKMISPLSIYMDLSMTYNGAGGSTRKAMQKALQLKDTDTAILNKTSQALLQNLPNEDPGVTMDMANAIWYRKGLNPLERFLNTNSTYYQAKLQAGDFDNPKTKTNINNWVAQKTHQKIKSIVDRIDPSDIMFLLNAVYFKGEWTHSFDPKQTKNREFHIADKQGKQVPFMYQKAKFNYAGNNEGQIIELPYGDGKFSMYVMLPGQKNEISPQLSSFDEASFSKLIDEMDSSQVRLFLPKWEAAYTVDNLKPELSQMGMGIAFGSDADFTNMYNSNQTLISDVVHKTYIKVDEKGTEAAAATSVGIKLTAVHIGSIPVMDVNKPFFYVITEKKSGAILFIGKVNDPSLTAE